MTVPIHIRACGMVTAVGLDAASSCAAMRARLDGFRETRFLGPGGAWLVGGAVPLPRNWIGQKRMVHLAAGAVVDALAAAPEAEADLALILCLAEETRPGRPIADPAAFLRDLSEIVGLPARTRTHMIAHGRPSGFVALERARRLVAEGAENVVILGVDSYLTGQTMAHYLGQRRLLHPENANGFIPGEAAAAVLCGRDRGALRLAGLGLARESAYLYNGDGEGGLPLPLRADGMVEAYRLAMDQAGAKHSDITLKIGDLIGEGYWFKQTALAMLRLQRERSEVQPIWTAAASLGNVGAAVVPLILGWAMTAASRRYAPSGPILLEATADDGACGAAVLVRA